MHPCVIESTFHAVIRPHVVHHDTEAEFIPARNFLTDLETFSHARLQLQIGVRLEESALESDLHPAGLRPDQRLVVFVG
jgi:hypothetical protein